MLREGWQGRRFYKIVAMKGTSKAGAKGKAAGPADNHLQVEEDKNADEAVSMRTEMKEENVLLEICIKPREFCDMDCKLLIIRNISHVAR